MSIGERIRRTADRVRNEPGLGRNVGVVITLIALAAVTGGVLLANQRVNWPWNDKFSFYAAFDASPGVSANHGQEVRIAGVSVGQIDSAKVDDDGNAELKLSIDPKYKVYDNATVVLRPKSPLNEMYVELNPGGAPGHKLRSGGHLAVTNSERPIEVDEVLGHLDSDSRAALTSLLSESDIALANAQKYLPSGLNSTDKLLKEITPVAEALSTRRDTIKRLITTLQQISGALGGDDDRLTRLADSLQTTLSAIGDSSGPMDASLKELPVLTKQLNEASTAVRELTKELNPTLDNLKGAADNLPKALKKVTGTADQAGETVDQLKPLLTTAQPVLNNLRPLTRDLLVAMPEFKAVTLRLDPITATAVSYLRDLGAFVLNTRSITSLRDENGGILRGLLEITPGTLPAGLLPELAKPSE